MISLHLLLLPLLLLPPATSVQPGDKFNYTLAQLSFEYAAASYADDPSPCLSKNGASLVMRVEVACDAVRDKCWAIVANAPEYIVVAFQGTSSRTQLIAELIETITSPKHDLEGIGSVQRYFYVALKSISKPLVEKLIKLKETYPHKPILFTGHSLGGALASLAAVLYANHTATLGYNETTYLYTFGQPRVGNHEYSSTVDRLVPQAWRLVHKADLVAHIPYCVGFRSCGDFLNHSPYHHGTEVFFAENMGPHDLYKVCTGLPLDEDSSCSDANYLYNIDDHLFYFEEHVSDYGVNGCRPMNSTVEGIEEPPYERMQLRRLRREAVKRMIQDYIEYLEDPRRLLLSNAL